MREILLGQTNLIVRKTVRGILIMYKSFQTPMGLSFEEINSDQMYVFSLLETWGRVIPL